MLEQRLNKFEMDLWAELFTSVLTGMAGRDFQTELAAAVLKLSSKQPDIPAINYHGWVDYWVIHVIMVNAGVQGGVRDIKTAWKGVWSGHILYKNEANYV